MSNVFMTGIWSLAIDNLYDFKEPKYDGNCVAHSQQTALYLYSFKYVYQDKQNRVALCGTFELWLNSNDEFIRNGNHRIKRQTLRVHNSENK